MATFPNSFKVFTRILEGDVVRGFVQLLPITPEVHMFSSLALNSPQEHGLGVETRSKLANVVLVNVIYLTSTVQQNGVPRR